MSKLISISIKQDDFSLPTPEVLQEQNIAIYDLKTRELPEREIFNLISL